MTRILILDDERFWIDFALNDLESYEIEVASDTATAMAMLEAKDFDLVIASSRRLDALSKIRERHTQERVLVATMRPSLDEAIRAYDLGAVRYRPKSFRKHALSKEVGELLADEPPAALAPVNAHNERQ